MSFPLILVAAVLLCLAAIPLAVFRLAAGIVALLAGGLLIVEMAIIAIAENTFSGSIPGSENQWIVVATVIAALGAIASSVVAVHEARARERAERERESERKSYANALESIIAAGNYAHHLKELASVDINVANAAKSLEKIAKQAEAIVSETEKAVRTSVDQIQRLTATAADLGHELREVGKIALRSQRESLKAHDSLIDRMAMRPTNAPDEP